jgi:hypothetical protein
MTDSVLGPDEILVERPFTDPEFTRREAEVMRAMLAREREYAQAWRGDHGRRAGGRIVRDHDDDKRRHFLVVPDTRALVEASGLTAIGFFGRVRDDVDHAVLFELEDELVGPMSDGSAFGLLSYYDVEFVKGAYGNLVLFSTPDGPKEWSADVVHRRAVEVSPEHYFEVRLHRGLVAGGLLDGGELAIASTKYLDFTGQTTWHCVRRWPAP